MDALTITADEIEVAVDPARGGRIAQMWFGGTPLLIDEGTDPIAWGAYVMLPWAGRLRHGRFVLDGVTHQLRRNHGDHAIHGVGYTSEWHVTAHHPTWIELALRLPTDDRWPFGGSATQTIAVSDDGLGWAVSVTADDRAFPACVGWHPWFRKPTRLDAHPEAMYRRDATGIAVDELVAVPPPPWDDCFVHHTPVGLRIDGVDVVVESACTDWVIYDEPEHATCIEPQTGPPDAFNIAPHVLRPGDSLRASMRVRPGVTAR